MGFEGVFGSIDSKLQKMTSNKVEFINKKLVNSNGVHPLFMNKTNLSFPPFGPETHSAEIAMSMTFFKSGSCGAKRCLILTTKSQKMYLNSSRYFDMASTSSKIYVVATVSLNSPHLIVYLYLLKQFLMLALL